MIHSGDLRVPKDFYCHRKDRLQRLLKLDAPPTILAREAEIFLKCFKTSWRVTWHNWKLNHVPH